MENVLSDDAKKKLEEIFSAFDAIIVVKKKLPSANSPPAVLSPGYPIDIFFVDSGRFRKSVNKAYERLKPFCPKAVCPEHATDHHKESFLFTNHSHANSGVTWLKNLFLDLVATYGLRDRQASDFEHWDDVKESRSTSG